jgi:hypothetical protein
VNRRRWVAVAFLIVSAGVAGYAVGESETPDVDDVRVAREGSFEVAVGSAREAAFDEAWHRGMSKGKVAGKRAGESAGAAAGRRRGDADAATALAEAEARAVQDEIAANVAESEQAFETCSSEVPGTAAYADCILGTGVPTGAQPDDPTGTGCPPGYYPDPSGGDSCLPQ